MACARSSGPHSGHPSAPANPQGGPPDPPSCSRRVLAWAPLHVPDCSEGSAQTGPWLPGQSSPGSQETPLWSAGAAARGPETLGGRWRPVTCLPGGGGWVSAPWGIGTTILTASIIGFGVDPLLGAHVR